MNSNREDPIRLLLKKQSYMGLCCLSWQTVHTLIRLLLKKKQSDLGLRCLSLPFGRQITFKILEHVSFSVRLSGLEITKCLSEWQTEQTQIRLPHLGLHVLSLPFCLANNIQNFRTFFFFCSHIRTGNHKMFV